MRTGGSAFPDAAETDGAEPDAEAGFTEAGFAEAGFAEAGFAKVCAEEFLPANTTAITHRPATTPIHATVRTREARLA
jgi:hypothetical protein